jgi:hypothetical protein
MIDVIDVFARRIVGWPRARPTRLRIAGAVITAATQVRADTRGVDASPRRGFSAVSPNGTAS